MNTLARSFAPRLAAYESSDLNRDEVISLFQDLTDSGLVWELQDSYQREAVRLIEAGQVNFNWKEAIDR